MVIKTDHMAYLCSLGEASSVADNPYPWAHRRIRELESELAEARRDSARLEELYRRSDVDPRGYLVFRPIRLPKNADWDGVTCKWDRDIFNAAIDAAMEEAK